MFYNNLLSIIVFKKKLTKILILVWKNYTKDLACLAFP